MEGRDMSNLNIWCAKCEIPMIYSHTSECKECTVEGEEKNENRIEGSYYKCPGCEKILVAYYDNNGEIQFTELSRNSNEEKDPADEVWIEELKDPSK